MDQNNKITSDIMPVARLPKRGKGQSVSRPRRAAPAAPTIPTTMSQRDWIALTSRNGNGALPAAPARHAPAVPVQPPVPAQPSSVFSPPAEKCGSCNRPKITSAGPAAVCTLCRLKFCYTCKSSKGVYALEDHKVSGIPANAFAKNDHEKKILSDYLKEKKLDYEHDILPRMLSDMEATKWTYKNTLGADINLTKRSEICDDCFATVWSDLLYRYRVSIQNILPETIRKRPNCWFGQECKTQTHNQQHA